MARTNSPFPDRSLSTTLAVVLAMVGAVVAAMLEMKRPKPQRRAWLVVLAWTVVIAGGVYLVGWRWALFHGLLEALEAATSK